MHATSSRPSSARHVSAYSGAAKPPTETQIGMLELREPRQRLGQERVAPRVRETYRVQHPRVGLRDPHGRVALAGLGRDGLRHERVQLLRCLRSPQSIEAAGRVQQHIYGLTVKLFALTAVPADLMTRIFPVVAPDGTCA